MARSIEEELAKIEAEEKKLQERRKEIQEKARKEAIVILDRSGLFSVPAKRLAAISREIKRLGFEELERKLGITNAPPSE